MRVEQLLTLTAAEDGIYRHEGYILLKDKNSVSVVSKDDHSAFAKLLNPNLKLANSIETVSVVMPSAVSQKYSNDDLRVVASVANGKTLEEKVQDALVRLAASGEPMPDVPSLMTLSSMIGKSPGILTLRFAQWGGQGGMSGSEGGQFNASNFEAGDVNENFGRWRANIMFDAMLDMARKNDHTQWDTSTEGKLARAGFYSHKFADENAAKYNMTWSERIKHKNLERLQRMFKQREKEKMNEEERSPKHIRLHEPINPRAFDTVEKFLGQQRGEEERDFWPKRKNRLEEWTPEWHSQLSTLRRFSSLNKSSYGHNTTFEEGSNPNRRAPSKTMSIDPSYSPLEDPNFMGGATGASASTWGNFGVQRMFESERETVGDEPINQQYPFAEGDRGVNGQATTMFAPGEDRTSLMELRDGDIEDEQEFSSGLSGSQLPMFDHEEEPTEQRLNKTRFRDSADYFDDTTPQTDTENPSERTVADENIVNHYWMRGGRG